MFGWITSQKDDLAFDARLGRMRIGQNTATSNGEDSDEAFFTKKQVETAEMLQSLMPNNDVPRMLDTQLTSEYAMMMVKLYL